eukprot:875594-Pelagomonas_calceolata.AAC.2
MSYFGSQVFCRISWSAAATKKTCCLYVFQGFTLRQAEVLDPNSCFKAPEAMGPQQTLLSIATHHSDSLSWYSLHFVYPRINQSSSLSCSM